MIRYVLIKKAYVDENGKISDSETVAVSSSLIKIEKNQSDYYEVIKEKLILGDWEKV